jgi:hypothetical protein
MFGRRSRMIIHLIFYFAGFATAIYFCAPVPGEASELGDEKTFVEAAFKSDEFAKDFNIKLHEVVAIVKEAGYHAGKLLKQTNTEAIEPDG